jgi:ketosteroid isomerase-like protein
MKYLLLLLFCTWLKSHAQPEKDILAIMDTQSKSWNEGNLEAFMQGYWNNDSLMFVGKSGITYGYQNTLNNYKKSFPDTAAMGKLTLTVLHVSQLSPEYYFLAGKYYLNRTAGDLQGHYTLLFRKIRGKWMIVVDHSS